MDLNVVGYLKSGKSIENLCNEFSIKTRRHNKYTNLVLFKYDQINSPKTHPIVKECRGLILDENDDWKVICFPYSRFYNYSESGSDEIDWSSARVYDKVDGSLMTLYYYDNQWQVSSSGTPDASGNISDISSSTFKDLFWKTWNEMGYTLDYANKNYCYMFELCTPYNRIVVHHKTPKIVLHGARDLRSLKESNPIVEAHKNNWECVKTYNLQSWEDIIKVSKELDPMKSEGFVVCDCEYNRVKVKSPQYVALSHIRDSFSVRRMIEIIRTNEHAEFLSYFEEFKDMFNEIKPKFEYLVGKIEGFYEAIKHIEERKEFAMIAKSQKFSAILFGIKFGSMSSVREALVNTNIKVLEEWLNVKPETVTKREV